MADKFQNRYRIPSTRLANWDYSSNAAYFVTICTQDRVCYFGDIVETPNLDVSIHNQTSGNDVQTHGYDNQTHGYDNQTHGYDNQTPKLGVSTPQIKLSEIGQMAYNFWIEIPNHFPFVELDVFVVMPNHVHGIIVIDKNDTVQTTDSGVSPDTNSDCNVQTPESGVSTPHANPTAAASEKWKSGTLGVIINQYKRAVTINARNINANFGWQSRFHDHIIRNNDEWNRIRQYIINNPNNWDTDKFYH